MRTGNSHSLSGLIAQERKTPDRSQVFSGKRKIWVEKFSCNVDSYTGIV